MLGFSFISCEKEFDTSFQLTKTLINKTNTTLFYYIKTTVGIDSTISYGNDSVSFIFIHKSHVTRPFLSISSSDIEGVGMRSEIIYNLSDTSFFSFNLIKASWTRKDSIYYENRTYKVEGSGLHEQHFETFQFQDTLKSFMTKDYSMLTRFKEYYSQ